MTDLPPLPGHGLILPPRTPWRMGFPDVVIHTTLATRDSHPMYEAAKAGDLEAALILSQELLDPGAVAELHRLVGDRDAVLLPIAALEVAGFNAIPDAMADVLAKALGWEASAGDIVQNNKVGHTRARAFNRLVTPAAFEGRVIPGARYVLVDDHVGLGGTLANLKGYVEAHDAEVVAMTTLTESREARHIALQAGTLDMLRERHGEELENLWREQLGHGLDCLTNVEAGILHREPTLESIRNRLAQAAIEARVRGLAPAIGDRLT
jgi:hypothetical protein